MQNTIHVDRRNIRLNHYWNSSGTLYTRIIQIFVFFPVKTYLSYNTCVVFGFILTLLFSYSVLVILLHSSRLLTIFVLFVLYVKASRMIRTVIRIGSCTHTCSYLLGMYIFMFISRKNHT